MQYFYFQILTKSLIMGFVVYEEVKSVLYLSPKNGEKFRYFDLNCQHLNVKYCLDKAGLVCYSVCKKLNVQNCKIAKLQNCKKNKQIKSKYQVSSIKYIQVYPNVFVNLKMQFMAPKTYSSHFNAIFSFQVLHFLGVKDCTFMVTSACVFDIYKNAMFGTQKCNWWHLEMQ